MEGRGDERSEGREGRLGIKKPRKEENQEKACVRIPLQKSLYQTSVYKYKYQSLFEVRSDLGWALVFAQGVSPGCGSH